MTAHELKRLYESNDPDGRFFSRENMRFFNDTMGNFSVKDGGKVKHRGKHVEVWALCRRKPVNGGLHGFVAYFRKDSGKIVQGTG